MISLKGLNKAAVLAALYNASKPLGNSIIHYVPGDMSLVVAESLLLQRTEFDYVQGRILKVKLGGDEFDPTLYDRDNGEGAAQRVIEALRIKKVWPS